MELAGMLINAYASPYVQDAVPGLRAAIAASAHEDGADRVRSIVAFLVGMDAPFDVIDAQA